jgi:uncharacterized protein
MVVLTASLVGSKLLLDELLRFDWPVVVYVAIVATLGYAPSVWWCRYVSARWGTGDLGTDIGVAVKWSDLGWGPVVWLGAVGAQIVAALLVVWLGVPISGNTEAIDNLTADRTYIVSIVITAVIAAPIVEEMVFRGVVLRSLRSRTPAVAAIVLQGLLFGLAHVDPVRGAGNVGLVMVLSAVGIAFGVSSHLLRRLGPSMVAHALFNGAVLLVVLTGAAGRVQDVGSVGARGDRVYVGADVGEQIDVVDQADVAEANRQRETGSTRRSTTEVENRFEGRRIEHGRIVE